MPPLLHQRIVDFAWSKGESLNQTIVNLLDSLTPAGAAPKPGRARVILNDDVVRRLETVERFLKTLPQPRD
jgi:hypothetical protein